MKTLRVMTDYFDPFRKEPKKAEARKLRGMSVIAYSKKEVDFSKNLLGNRWLSRRTGCFIVAPSGHGKSTLVTQMMILWSCGRSAFGIHPPQPLRVLLVQAEDDENDTIEMSKMAKRLSLTPEQEGTADRNTHTEWLCDVNYVGFFEALNDALSEFPCDLLIINPYSAYQGSDLKDEERNNDFLRDALSKLMAHYNIGTLLVHHTPKTNFQKTEDYSWFDWMYTMAGTASITNWARGILVLNPTKVRGTYQFIAAKRFEKIGWDQPEQFWSHSIENGVPLWVAANQDQLCSAKPKKQIAASDLLDLLPLVDGITRERFIELAAGRNVGENRARRLLNLLIEDQLVQVTETPRNGNRPVVTYNRVVTP